jgi:hypothetical protein
MPPKLDIDVLIAALKDSRVVEALSQALLPGIQAAIQTAVESTIGELKVRLDEQIECSKKLQVENELLRGRIEDIESYNRMDNLMIYGLPENFAETVAGSVNADDGEDDREDSPSSVNSELQFISFCRSKLHVDVSANDICTAHRLPRKSGVPARGPRPMIVRFNNRKTRSRVMAAKKGLRQDPTCRVYINEHLTKSVTELFAAARKLQRDKRLFRTWTFNGRVYVKITESPTSRPLLVKSEEHLRSLV